MFSGRLIWIGIVLVIAGVIMFGVGVTNYFEDNRLDAEGKTVQGEVVGGHSSVRRRGGRSYKLEVAYGDAGARRHRKEFSVSSSVFERAEQSPTVNVTYLPAEPQVARIGDRRDNAFGMGIGSVLFVAGGGCIAWLVARRRGT